jgi:hypothetical protein
MLGIVRIAKSVCDEPTNNFCVRIGYAGDAQPLEKTGHRKPCRVDRYQQQR